MKKSTYEALKKNKVIEIRLLKYQLNKAEKVIQVPILPY
jgi:hypothetical protein